MADISSNQKVATFNEVCSGAEALLHAGVEGQKWYQRRYQNPDGTYTELGKIRKRAYYQKNYSKDYDISRQDPRTLSNEDLRKASDRYSIESQYSKNKTEASPLNTTANKVKVGMAAAAVLIGAAVAGKKIYDLVKKSRNPDEIAIGRKHAQALLEARKEVTAKELKDAYKTNIINNAKRGTAPKTDTIESILELLKNKG